MKSIDADQLDKVAGKRLSANDTFRFHCHAGLACFNRCCRNLNLFLYPYDVVRLKLRLGLTSDAFLERFTDVVLRPETFFPEVLLKMVEDREKTCPFLTADGCSVYPDRPDTCRTFPVEQGSLYHAGSRKTELVRFFRPPDFCLGQYEATAWTPASWAKDQDAVRHNRMTLRWAALRRLFQADPWGREGPQGPKAKMAFMAAYNVDRFRDFVFNSTFLKRYKVKTALLKKIRRNDAELLTFGFQWIEFFVWGMRVDAFRPRR